jgi:hypothetical protein
MQFRFFRLGRRGVAVAAAALVVAVVGSGIGVARASDHQDNPLVELNPSMDMTDVYAFPGSSADRVALVMNSSAFLTPAATPNASFDPNLLYQFKVDNTGDAREDRVIQLVFKGTGPNQIVEVRGPAVPSVIGAMANTVLTSDPVMTGRINQTHGSPSGLQVFAGTREDPFFLDLEQFFRIVPDRKPSTGTLAALSDVPSASSFRSASSAVNYVRGFNVLSIIVEVPASMLTAGGNAKIGVWGTISR